MRNSAADFNLTCCAVRDEIKDLKRELRNMEEAGVK